MSGLRDMEELILKVKDAEIASLLREAIVCYGTGAYRACVIMSHIALFEGLLHKLRAISASNKIARDILKLIDKSEGEQKAFENDLINQMRSKEIITELEKAVLIRLNQMRHKAAHPSGHQVSPEEARYVFSEIIDKFLSKHIRQTSVLIEEFADKIRSFNMFPSLEHKDVLLIVKNELDGLDESGLPVLVKTITEIADEDPIEDYIFENSKNALMGLAMIKTDVMRRSLIKYAIEPHILKWRNHDIMYAFLYHDPYIINLMTDQTVMRMDHTLEITESSNIWHSWKSESPSGSMSMLISTLGENRALELLPKFMSSVAALGAISEEILTALSVAPVTAQIAMAAYTKRASTRNYKEANSFARSLVAFHPKLAEIATNQSAFELLCGMCKAAAFGATAPIEICDNQFLDLPELRSMALSFLVQNELEAEGIVGVKAVAMFREAIDGGPPF
jgi:uncharacterized protein YutE (UPF0331/DUF86 family)